MELPLELFDEEVLFAMGNTVCKTVYIDETTLEAAQGKYAHVCVQVDLATPLIPSITVLCMRVASYLL